MLFAPAHEREQHVAQCAALRGERVGIPHRPLLIRSADNDAGAFGTYTQAGQDYGTTLLWTLALLIPALYVNQEMVLRLGAVSGVGHARLIFERFGKFWGAFSVIDLLLLNALTIVTEFIDISLALGFLGVSKPLGVILAAALKSWLRPAPAISTVSSGSRSFLSSAACCSRIDHRPVSPMRRYPPFQGVAAAAEAIHASGPARQRAALSAPVTPVMNPPNSASFPPHSGAATLRKKSRRFLLARPTLATRRLPLPSGLREFAAPYLTTGTVRIAE